MLNLQPEIRRTDMNAVERRIAIKDAVALEYVRVLHREDVGRRFPFAHGERQRRGIPVFGPCLRHRGDRPQPLERQRINNHQHVVIRFLRIVLAGDRGAE